MTPVTFQFFRAPVSVNHSQWSKQVRAKGKGNKKFVTRRINTYDTRRYVDYLYDIMNLQKSLVPPQILEQLRTSKYYAARYIFIDRFMQLRDTNEPMKKDVSNLIKITEDAVMKSLDQNDKKVFHNFLHKVHIPDERHARFILTLVGYNTIPTLRQVYTDLLPTTPLILLP